MPGSSTAFQVGNHAGRPAAGAGCVLYACTDHDLVYQSDGTTWTTFYTGVSGMTNPMTTAGDVIYSSDGSGTPARLGVGSNGDVLTLAAGIPSWAAPASGGVPTLSGVRVRAVADVALTSGSVVYITWDTEDYDTDAYHSTVTNTSRLTVPAGKAGYYRISAAGLATGSAGNGYSVIRLNGTTIICSGWYGTDSSSTNTGATTVYNLAETDYVEFGVKVGATSKSLIDAGVVDPFFEMVLVGT